jgi:hypothetical protein
MSGPSNQDWDKVVIKPKATKGKKDAPGAGGAATEKKCAFRAPRAAQPRPHAHGRAPAGGRVPPAGPAV